MTAFSTLRNERNRFADLAADLLNSADQLGSSHLLLLSDKIVRFFKGFS